MKRNLAKIYWTSEAEITFQQNLEYLSKQWDNNVIISFLDRVEEVLNLIELNPEIYPYHRRKDKVRKCIINERMILYFKQINKQSIHLLTFWNTYRNSNNLKV